MILDNYELQTIIEYFEKLIHHIQIESDNTIYCHVVVTCDKTKKLAVISHNKEECFNALRSVLEDSTGSYEEDENQKDRIISQIKELNKLMENIKDIKK